MIEIGTKPEASNKDERSEVSRIEKLQLLQLKHVDYDTEILNTNRSWAL